MGAWDRAPAAPPPVQSLFAMSPRGSRALREGPWKSPFLSSPSPRTGRGGGRRPRSRRGRSEVPLGSGPGPVSVSSPPLHRDPPPPGLCRPPPEPSAPPFSPSVASLPCPSPPPSLLPWTTGVGPTIGRRGIVAGRARRHTRAHRLHTHGHHKGPEGRPRPSPSVLGSHRCLVWGGPDLRAGGATTLAGSQTDAARPLPHPSPLRASGALAGDPVTP